MNSTLSPSPVILTTLPSNSTTVSSSRTVCPEQTVTAFHTNSVVETVIVSVSTITTVYFHKPEVIAPSSVPMAIITGPTTFITTVGFPLTLDNRKNDCCGDCSIYYPSVSLKYWPVASPNISCLDHPATSTPLAAREYDLPTDVPLPQSYAVGSDGFTYISPSVYVEFGDVTAGDMCGTVGALHTSVTLAFKPGELSTYDWRGFRAFDPNDMPCGPGQPFVLNGMGIQAAPKGAIYKPTIALPEKLRSLDPAWARCVTDWYQGEDPPHPLTPVAMMDPGITTAGPSITQTLATPSSAPKGPPVNTGVGGAPGPSPEKDNGSSTSSTLEGHASAGAALSLSNTAVSTPTQLAVGGTSLKGSGPPAPPDGDPKVESKPAAENPPSSNGLMAVPSSADAGFHDGVPVSSIADPATTSQLSTSDGHSEVSVAPAALGPAQTTQYAASATPAPAVMVQGHTIAENSPPVTIGGIPIGFSSGSIYVGTNVAPAPTHAPQQPSVTVFQGFTLLPLPPNDAATTTLPIATVGGKIFTAVGPSSEIAIGDTTLKPGDAPITVAGTLLSIGSGIVAIGSSTITLSAPPINGIFTLADNSFTANPTGFSIADTSLLPGSPAITISGAPPSLASSGVLFVGSSTVLLNPPRPTPPPITLASQTITANSLSHYIVDSQTLVPGGPAITVNGTPISVPATPSAVVVGTSTEILATSAGAGIGAAILSGLGGIGRAESTAATTGANGSYTGPMVGASAACAGYRWAWELQLGVGVVLGAVGGWGV